MPCRRWRSSNKDRKLAMWAERKTKSNDLEKVREHEKQRKAECKANSSEKVKEWRQNRMNRIEDEMFTCPVCNYDVRKQKKSQHEESQKFTRIT